MRGFPHCVALFLSMTAPAIAEVDFVHQVVPILKEHCNECHGGEEAKGGFSINTRELFLDDETAVPGVVAESYFLELIEDPDPEFQMPPEKKSRVPADHVAVLKQWVNEGMKWEPGFTFGESKYEPPLKPRRPELPPVTEGRTNPIDRFLDAWLTEHEQPHPESISDLAFLRRIHLDLIGLLPTPEEAQAFLADDRDDKRALKIDELLDRRIAYADHWLTFWNDLLRNDYAGTGFITGGRTQVSGWLYDRLKTNAPFDEMVRELISPPNADSSGFIDGIKWRGEVSAGQTLPIQFSQSVSQSLLGINMKCASCHDSFIDRWTLAEAYGLAAIYSEEPLEIHRCDKPVGETARAAWLFPEIGDIDPAAPKPERLSQLAALMTHPDNGRVQRTIVNRIWGQLMGRGLVHPLDAMHTEPWHADLLDFLAIDFRDQGYDLQHTIRLIANSAAYQSEAESVEGDDGGEYVYAGPRAKRLTAEQFVDAVWQWSGSAPEIFDAPIVRGIAAPEEAERLQTPSSWIWGPSATGGPPPAGEQVLLRRDFKPAKPVRSMGIVAAADNSFTLYLNTQPVLSGDQWHVLRSAPASVYLREGVNRILILATNAGSSPNAAGAFCAARIVYEDGTEEVISTDETWQVSTKIPEGDKPGKWKIPDLPWQAVTLVTHPSWPEKVDPQVGTLLAASSASSQHMVRASLVKSDFLMRSLGRPNRDQIVTSRPNELTTLEAIDLANNAELAGYLRAGAERLVGQQWKSAADLVTHLYLSTLTRPPSEKELEILVSALGESPDAATVADISWAIAMTPEFLYVR